jgi:hypothetical protein
VDASYMSSHSKSFKSPEGKFGYQYAEHGYSEAEGYVRSGTFTKKSFNSSEKRQDVEVGKKTTTEKHGWKRKSDALYEIEEEGEHVYILVRGMRFELFEGEYCWYYIDEVGEKHFVGFER